LPPALVVGGLFLTKIVNEHKIVNVVGDKEEGDDDDDDDGVDGGEGEGSSFPRSV
jgi:hypothetical protein